MQEDGTLLEYQDIRSVKPNVKTINNLEELSELLTDLETQPYRLVVRGVPQNPNVWGLRRKDYFTFPPVNWLCLDFDKPAPEGCPDYVEDPEGAITYMIEHHWSFLKGVAIHWQLGNSAGLVPASKKMSFHLWVWLAEPVIKCRGWLEENGFDSGLTDAVRVHYTASPEGVNIPRRSGFIQGGELQGPVEDYVETTKGPSVDMTELDCPPWRAGELIKELHQIVEETGRHDRIRKWVKDACAEGMPDVVDLATEQLVTLGRDEEIARGEVERLYAGAVEKMAQGKLNASDAAMVKNVFQEDNTKELDPESAKQQAKELTGPSVIDEVRESDKPLEVLKRRGISGWGPLELAELEEVLNDKGVLGNRPGQIGRQGLKTLAKEKERDLQVSEDVIEKYRNQWENTYCTEDGGGYKYYIFDGQRLRVASVKNEVDVMCQYLSTGLSRPDALLFREHFFKVIHEERQVKQWETLAQPFGNSMTVLELREDKFFNAIVQTSFHERLAHLCKRSQDVVVPKAFEDLMDREYGVVFDVMQAALMRRFLGDKRSTVWIHCCSDWGKSFLFDIPELCLTLDNDYSGETFKGNEPAELNEKVYFFVDEADRFTKHMKRDTLPYRKLYGGQVYVTLPLRIIASANNIGDLSGHADEQLLNRVIKINADQKKLKEVMQAAGYTTDTARRLYVVMLVRRMKQWLEEAPENFQDYANEVFDAFARDRGIKGVESNEEDIRAIFYHHFIWDYVEEVAGKYKKKKESDFVWLDNGSSTHPDRRRLYIKKPDAWRKFFIESYYGDRVHTIRKTLSGVEDAVRILGATICNALPDGTRFKGFWVPLGEAEADASPFEDGCGHAESSYPSLDVL
jgi:hypothetical protein